MNTLDKIAARAKALAKSHSKIGNGRCEFETFANHAANETAYLTDAVSMLIARVKLAEDRLEATLRPWEMGYHIEPNSTYHRLAKKALAAARKLEDEFQEKHK